LFSEKIIDEYKEKAAGFPNKTSNYRSSFLFTLEKRSKKVFIELS
jgi:hypothetical protein